MLGSSMGDVSALIAGERRLVRSHLLDGLARRDGRRTAARRLARPPTATGLAFGVVVVGLRFCGSSLAGVVSPSGLWLTACARSQT